MSESVSVSEQVINLEISDKNGVVEIISSPVIEFRVDSKTIEIHVEEIKNTVDVSQENIVVEIATNVSTSGVWTKNSQTIPANSSKDIDQNELSNFIGITYVITLWNDDRSLVRKFSLSVENKNGTIESSLYARSGNLTDIRVLDNISGTTGKLTIENNNNFLLNYTISKLIQ